MQFFIFPFALIAVAVVATRCICVAAALNFRDWTGHPARFFGVAIGYSLLAAGALAVIFLKPHGGSILLIGVAMTFVFDRRRPHVKDRTGWRE